MSFFFKLFSAKKKFMIIPDAMQFCLDSALFEKCLQFLDGFDTDSLSISSEFSLEHTAQHQRFVEEFEKAFEEFLKQKGSNPEDFFELCRVAVEDLEDDNVATFIDLLFQVLDFQVFMDLARDPNKRKYFFGIMKAYSEQLAQAMKDK